MHIPMYHDKNDGKQLYRKLRDEETEKASFAPSRNAAMIAEL